MAKTYAGYVKRDVAKDVNWSAVATSISDVLTDSVKEREQKKAAIDKESRELGKRLTDAEGSQHSGLNQFYLDGANSIQEIRRIQDDLLKKGQLSLRDYNIQRQNVVDGVDELLGTVSSYNQLYEEKMKKYDQLSGQDKYQMENIEGFSNFNNHQVYVNPLDGRVSLGKRVMGENGIMRLSEDPNDFMTISSLKNRLNRDILKYDWNKNLQEGVDRIGRIKLVINKLGVKTREGQKELENYEKSKADWIDSMMQDDVHMGSMLSDWIGGYSFNQEKDGDEKTIQLIQDPNGSPNLVPVITKGMKDVIRERLSEEFDARVDKIEEALPITETDKSRGITAKTDQDTVTLLAQVQSGQTEQDRKIAATNLAGLEKNKNIIKIVEYTDKLLVTRQTPKGETFTETIIKPSNTREFVKGASTMLTDIKDLNKALQQSGITVESIGATGITDGTVLFERTTPPKPPSGLVRFDAQLNSDFNPNVITDEDFKDDATVQGKLAPIATKYGVTIVNPTRVTGDSLIFKIGTGNNEVTQEIDFSETGREGLLEALKGFIKSNKDATERFLSLESDKPPAY